MQFTAFFEHQHEIATELQIGKLEFKFGVYFWLCFLNDHTFQSIYYPRRWDGKWTITTNANIYGSTDILKEKKREYLLDTEDFLSPH